MIRRRDIGLLGLGMALSACAGSGPRPTPGRARIAFGATIESLDPLVSINAYPLFRSIFDSLTEIRPDGSLGPRLATTWTASDDATEWLFTLRDDARWSDGSPLTVADVVFSLETIRTSPASLNRQYLANVTAIEAAGPHAVRFRLARPFAAWPRQMSLLSIVQARAYRSLGAEAFARSPIGSGPYRVVSWTQGLALELAANPHHAGGPPAIPHISIISMPEEAARLNALESGDIDAITVTPQQVPLLEGRPGIAIQRTPSNRVCYLGLTVTDGPLRDVRVRQAIDCAIDREAICRYLLRGAATPIGQLVAPGTFGYDPALGAIPHDPARARILLRAAGYAGEPLMFQYPVSGPIPLSGFVAQAIEGCLKAAGIVVQMQGMEQNAFVGDWLAGMLQGLYMFAFNPSTMDAGLVTGSLIGPGGVRSFADPEMDRLEALQMTQTDPARRAGTFAEIWARNRQQAYYAPLFSDVYVYASAQDRMTLVPRRDGYITAHELGAPVRMTA